MTICKACGVEIEFAYLEKHICPKPNPEYEAERDKYRKGAAELRSRDERLGIAELPRPPIWVELEVYFTDGRFFRYIIPKNNFQFLNGRLRIEPIDKQGWREGFESSLIARHRFREFADEAAARGTVAVRAPEEAKIIESAATLPEKFIKPSPEYLTDMKIGVEGNVSSGALLIRPDKKAFLRANTALEKNSPLSIQVKREAEGFVVWLSSRYVGLFEANQIDPRVELLPVIRIEQAEPERV